jgi:hypothetical protein
MVRTQISLEDAQYQFVKEHAHRQGESLSAVIRRAVDQLRLREVRPLDPALAVLGAHSADVADAAEEHDRYLLLASEPAAPWDSAEGDTP